MYIFILFYVKIPQFVWNYLAFETKQKPLRAVSFSRGHLFVNVCLPNHSHINHSFQDRWIDGWIDGCTFSVEVKIVNICELTVCKSLHQGFQTDVLMGCEKLERKKYVYDCQK